ncbi:MAG: bifunctional DNA primase/polymerase, partial [Proteobacteria bacterium]|nr:bifunctional DNA primase/polymerase [Pseudomonadota bacterium]
MTSSADQTHQLAECETLAAALSYAELGWRVHPLPPGQKAPPLTRWQDLATTDPATVENWWTERPAANVSKLIDEAWVGIDACVVLFVTPLHRITRIRTPQTDAGTQFAHSTHA